MKREGKRLSGIVRVINKYHLVKEATPERLRQALEELGPTFIKIGQIMSSRPDLVPKEYCAELKKLRSNVKPMEFSLVTEILDREYNDETWNIFASIEEVPIGSASIAQTHRATLKNGDEVVIKIEREHVYETMTQDIKLLKSVVRLLHLDKLFSSVLDIDSFLDEMYQTALEEMDFLMEARHMKEFANNQKDVRYIKPIRVYDEYCTRNALVMEYIGGYNINQLDSLTKDGYDIKEISEKLAYNYIKQALDDGFFHADPHSDNIKIDDGKIVFLDFGMMGRLTHHNRKLLDACIRAIVSNEYSEVGHILTVMNTNNYPIDHMRLNNDIKRVLDKNKTAEIANIDIKGFALDMFSMLNDNKIILPRDITMLLRGIIVIAGLLEEIDPTVSLMQVLQTYFDPKDMFTKDKFKDYASTVVRSGADLMVIPKEALTLLKGINTGELRFNVEMTDSTGQITRMEKLFHLGIITVLDVALIIGIPFISDTNPVLFAFYVIAAIICTCWLFVKMFVSRIRRK